MLQIGALSPAPDTNPARANLALSLLQQRRHGPDLGRTVDLAIAALHGASLDQLLAVDLGVEDVRDLTAALTATGGA